MFDSLGAAYVAVVNRDEVIVYCSASDDGRGNCCYWSV